MSTMTLDADDQEIIEIFVEEAEEVLQEIDRNLKALKANPKDKTALGEVRRGFHTLKGSGRMAKALDLGELAWKIENMLNRAIEGKVAVSEPMVALIQRCHGTMPKLVDAFKRQRPSGLDSEMQAMMGQADALASGETPSAKPRPAAATPAETAGLQAKLGELQGLLDQTAKRADEALQRAEMGLQQSRKLAGHLDAVGKELQRQGAGADLKPLAERVNSLSRDVLELRELARGAPQAATAPDTREVQQLIDQRVRERGHAGERLRQEMDKRLENMAEAVVSARRIAIWALTIGILLMIGAIGTAAYFLL